MLVFVFGLFSFAVHLSIVFMYSFSSSRIAIYIWHVLTSLRMACGSACSVSCAKTIPAQLVIRGEEENWDNCNPHNEQV